MKKQVVIISVFILLSITARFIAGYLFGDVILDNEWGKLVNNLNVSGTFGINVAINEFTAIHKFATETDKVLPTVYMPPLYAYFIFLIKILNNNIFDLVKVIIFTQILISLISVFIFYKILKRYQDINTSLIFTSIFSFFPLYIFSNGQISSITLQIFLLVCFFYFILKYSEENNFKSLFLFSLFSSLLILIRGEFFIFYLFTIFYFLLLSKKFKSLTISLLLTAIMISPYLTRNYNNFGSIVLTKSFGYNLLKGNNPHLRVEGSADYIGENYNQSDLKIKTSDSYEIVLDNFYKDKALEIIKQDPLKYLIFYFKKLLSFTFIDVESTYPKYYNPFHIIPKILLAIFSLAGATIAIGKRGFFQYLIIYYLISLFFFSFFFILPRYSLILLPVQLLLSLETLKYLRRKLFD